MAKGRNTGEKKGKKRAMKTRPKRPLSGYLLFIKAYMKQNRNKDPREAMREGAQKWRELDDDEKTKYNAKCQADRSRFQSQMVEYYKYLEARKCPRNGFAVFIQDFYANKFGSVNPTKFVENSRQAALLWHGLSDQRRVEYNHRFRSSYNRAMSFRKENDNCPLTNGRERAPRRKPAEKRREKEQEKYRELNEAVNEALEAHVTISEPLTNNNDQVEDHVQDEVTVETAIAFAPVAKRKGRYAPLFGISKRQRK